MCLMLSTSFLEIHFDFRNRCLLCSHTDDPSKYDLLIIIGHSYLHTYIYQIIPHHTKSMLPYIRGFLTSSLKWSQFATSDGKLLMFTRYFDGTDDNVFLHQPLTSQMASHKNGLDRFDSHITYFS